MLLILFLGINIYISHSIVKKAYINQGEEFYSPAIFDLNNYVNANNIDFNDIIFLEWGFHEQLYFLNKGEVKITQIQQRLYNKSDPKLSEVLENSLLYILKQRPAGSELYFPVYISRFEHVSNALLKVVDKLWGKAIIQKVFYEKNGDVVMYLYKVSGIDVRDAEMGNYNTKNGDNIYGIDSSENKSFINYSNNDYLKSKGVYPLENGFCWYSQDARLSLSSKNKFEFLLSYFIKDINSYSSPPYLSIYFDDELVHKEQITSSGNFEKKIKVSEKFNLDQIEVNVKVSNPLNTENDSRNLGIAVRKIGFR